MRLLQHPKLKLLSPNPYPELAEPGRLSLNGPVQKGPVGHQHLLGYIELDSEAQLMELSAWWAPTLIITEKLYSVTQRRCHCWQGNLKEEPEFRSSQASTSTCEH